MPLTVKRDLVKGRIFSPIRDAWYVDFPEELVRQEFVCVLVNDYGYELDQMGEELSTQRGREKAEADIVIWRTAQDKRDAKAPLIVVETKSNNVTITPRDYGQGESYARIVGAPFFVTHNQRETKVWRVMKDRMPGYTELITDLPKADASDKEIEELIKKLKIFKEDEFADLLHQCHNVIRNRDKLDPAAAFDEIAKILFIKVYVEREMRAKRKTRNLFTLAVLDEQFGDDPLNDLFAKMRAGYRDDKLFAAGAKINLKVSTGREIVKLLEKYNLSDTSEDVKGIAFERFLGRTFRGEIGQFFTPREVVKFMVEMVNPVYGDIVCDPASGSGGFLIRFFANVREQLTAAADAEYERTRAAVERKRIPAAKKAELLRQANEQRRRSLDPKNTTTPIYRLSNHCIYGTDANDRMARTSKMNMIMHGDGHGGVHHWDGFLNINGIFEGRFDVILTNPPFGANVEPEDHVLIPDAEEWESLRRKYNNEFGTPYREAVARVEKAFQEEAPIASLFELPKRGGDGKGKLGKIKTELLFLERCLDLLTDGDKGKKPAGRLGIVLPEGVFNNPSTQWVRDFVENRAWLRAVVSLPQETFGSSGASVKCSILFLQKFTAAEKQRFDTTRATARAEIEAKYAPEMEKEIERLEGLISALKETKQNNAARLQALQRERRAYERDMAARIAAESRALLKQRWDYPIFLYEAEHVGITATGEKADNELYPNDRTPSGCDKTCLELYRAFERDPAGFLVDGLAT
jgi:type I restriction enzyme M protein